MQLFPRTTRLLLCVRLNSYALSNYTFPHTEIKHMYIAQCIPDMYIIPDMGGG